ncbi:MAG: cation:proton antiporter [Deltaproteobacteria bacterium]|nr:cation:proton antiporter [Deltaproteobacteria bacterium]
MATSAEIQTIVFALNAGLISLFLAEVLKIPGIILYLICGILLGPFFFNLVQPSSLPLTTIIELGVAIIMFEGSMHLNIEQFRSASRVIRNLLTIGFVISVACIMLLSHWFFNWSWGVSLLFGILMSVTGPTVITPILRKVPLKPPLSSVLHWESIMLEPIVVISAILVVEFLIQEVEITVLDSLWRLVRILIVGIGIGSFLGIGLSFIMKKFPLKNEFFRNVFVLSFALLVFEISNHLIADSGLLAIVCAGLLVGNSKFPGIHEIKQFKENITRVIISILFILLAANLDWNLLTTFSPQVIILLVVLMFAIRPLVVFVSGIKSPITTNGKLFLSLTAPRGIVAASMASLLTIVFEKQDSAQATQQAKQFEILAYQVIFVTVFTQALWSKTLASLLRVKENEKRNFLIIGAHSLGIGIAKWLKERGINSVLIDRSTYNTYLAQKEGLIAYEGDALNEYFMDNLPLNEVGKLLALTSNDEVNTLACQLGRRYFPSEKIYQIHKTLKRQDAGFLKGAGGTIVFPKMSSLLNVLDGINKGNYLLQEMHGIPKENHIPLFLIESKSNLQLVTEETEFAEDSVWFGVVNLNPVPSTSYAS